MRWIVWALCAVFLAGCVNRMDVGMRKYEGRHRDDLVKRFGPPTQETSLSDGGTSMVYIERSASYSGPSPMNPYSMNEGSTRTCRMIFNADKNGIIRTWAHYGC